MNEIVLPVMLGIVSSLVATFIFLSLNWLIRNIMLPWYADKIYRGVRISGKWSSDVFSAATLTLTQKGGYVTGLYTHGTDKPNGTDKVESYYINGHISNSFLTVTFKPSENDNIDSATGLFHIFSGNNLLASFSVLITFFPLVKPHLYIKR